MRIQTIILFSLFFSFTATGEEKNTHPGPVREHKGNDHIENKLLANILELAKHLQECRSDIPQDITAQTQRFGQLRLAKLMQESMRLKATATESVSLQQHHKLLDSLMAVTSARHCRGHYIYAIRHIII